MINKKLIGLVILGISSVVSSFTYASTNISPTDTTPEVVHLRTDCTGVTNCATTFEELLPWVWGTRNPSAASPLLIEIGPGTHNIGVDIGPSGNLPLNICNGGGHVTFRGSGTTNTTITGWGGGSFQEHTGFYPHSVLYVKDCDNLKFQDFTVWIDGNGGYIGINTIKVGITWEGGGNSFWSNITVDGEALHAWRDKCSTTNETGVHIWHESELRPMTSAEFNTSVYYSTCGTTYFHGGAIEAVRTALGLQTWQLLGVHARNATSVVNIYNSRVGATLTPGSAAVSYSPSAGPLTYGHGGVLATNGGTINMHGGTLAVRAEHAADSSVFGARAIDANSVINTLNTAFDLLASGQTGVTERIILENGPYNPIVLWPRDSAPPSIQTPNIFDLFAENDCDATGDCDGTGTETHLMRYNDSCGIDPWLNVLTGECRGVISGP